MSGKPAARLGDPTDCPKKGHGTNPIAAGSPDVLFDGAPRRCLRLRRRGDSYRADQRQTGGGGGLGGQPRQCRGGGSGTVLIGTSVVVAEFIEPSPVSLTAGFDRLFSLETEVGQPLKNLAYRIVSESGIVKQGATSGSGMTGNISTGGQQEALTLYISGED